MTEVAGLAAVALLSCLALSTPALARPTLPFGVRVAAERVADPAIVGTRQIYARLVVLAAIVAAALSFVLNVSAIAVALGVVDMALYYLAYRRIRAVKRREWWQAEHRYGVTVDTTFRTDPVRLPLPWLSPAVAVLLVTAILGRWEAAAAQAAVTVVAPLAALVVLRARPDLDAARPIGSARRYRVYLRGIARLILLVAAGLNLALLLRAFPGWEIAAAVPAGVTILAFLVWEIRVGQAGHRLPALPGEEEERTGLAQRDDDKYWFIAGMIYVNRRDSAILVHRRVGAFWTLNLGHPIAWILIAAIAVLALLSGFGVIDLPERRNGF